MGAMEGLGTEDNLDFRVMSLNTLGPGVGWTLQGWSRHRNCSLAFPFPCSLSAEDTPLYLHHLQNGRTSKVNYIPSWS